MKMYHDSPFYTFISRKSNYSGCWPATKWGSQEDTKPCQMKILVLNYRSIEDPPEIWRRWTTLEARCARWKSTSYDFRWIPCIQIHYGRDQWVWIELPYPLDYWNMKRDTIRCASNTHKEYENAAAALRNTHQSEDENLGVSINCSALHWFDLNTRLPRVEMKSHQRSSSLV